MPEPTFQLYNTMSRAVAPLAPLHPPKVTLYVCGPTIYDYAHIGNFRTYVAVDLLRRALKHFGYQVDHVMQFTDVDDKTIKGSRA
jgi:cysteinyl-tRNA synthetase